MLLYSIIIPHYNSSNFIVKLLNSIPDSDDIETIIVDDCSCSDELDKLKHIVDNSTKNIRLLISERNSGAGACRNKGLKEANGQWIVFADADDYFTTDFSKILHNCQKSNADVVYFNASSVKMPELTPSKRHCEIDTWVSSKDEESLRFSFHGPVCKLIKSDLINKYCITFFESTAFNDALFSVKVGYYAQNIQVENMVGYCITESINSTTYTISDEIIKSRLEATIAFNRFLKEKHIKGHRMPILSQLFYARKLGLIGFLNVQAYYIRMCLCNS